MARTTASDVSELFDTDLSNPTLTSWIDIATELVDDIADADSSIDSTRLTKIEKLLAAHFAAAQDPRLEGYSVGGSSGTYQGETGMHLDGTMYGQQAKALDPSGTLSGVGKAQGAIAVPNSKAITSDERD